MIMEECNFNQSMTVEDLGGWLSEKGFSDEIRKRFEDEEMDGEAIFDAIGCQVGPDCLKDVLPKYGHRIKVYRAIKSAMGIVLQEEQQQTSGNASVEDVSIVAVNSPASSVSTNPASSVSTNPVSSVTSHKSLATSPHPSKDHCTTSKAAKSNKLPDPFPIPLFRQATEKHLANKVIYPDDRRYMVRVLGTMILSHKSKASTTDCERVAKALVQKFPFLKEYESWAHFIYVRCQNCNRNPSETEDEPKPKRQKSKPVGNHIYPALHGEPEDKVTHKRNMKLLDDECQKIKPISTNIKSLMSRTFLNRREWILNSEQPVTEIVKIYPCLTKVTYISQEMDMICCVEGTASLFDDNWRKYAHIMLSYGKSIPSQTKELKEILKSIGNNLSDSDELTDAEHIAALKCLASFLLIKPKKKKVDDQSLSPYTAIPFLLVDAPNSTSSMEFSDSNSHPYIVRLYDGDEALAPVYSVVVEQDVTIKCPNFTMALYSVFSLHYVFNISYHGKLNDIFLFLQEVVFQIPEEQCKRSANLSSFCAAIAAVDNKAV